MNRRGMIRALAALASPLPWVGRWAAAATCDPREPACFFSWRDGVCTHPDFPDGPPMGAGNHFFLDGRDVGPLLVMRAMTGPTGWIEVRARADGSPGRFDPRTGESDPVVTEFYDPVSNGVVGVDHAKVKEVLASCLGGLQRHLALRGCIRGHGWWHVGERVKTVTLRGHVRHEWRGVK